MKIGVISPQDWGLPVAGASSEVTVSGAALSPRQLEQRILSNVYEWLPRQFDNQVGAFYGFYRAPSQEFEPPQTANLIASWELMAAYDRYHDRDLLTKAVSATNWFYNHFVVTHPMSIGIGGVRDTAHREELWTKFTAEVVMSELGLYRRMGEETYLERALQGAGFLIQATRHNFAPKYDERAAQWHALGWQSFGRVIEAFLALEEVTGDGAWGERALQWGEFGLTLQAEDGSFYLIDDEYFNTDLVADELRALIFVHERTGDASYREAAVRFADWLLAWQREDGAWPLTIDRDGNVVVQTVGPGDVPNIATGLLRLHALTGQEKYWHAAAAAYRYSAGTQAVPGSDHPYLDDANVRWGFWSWDPYYDFTLSVDQSTHHVRGYMFLLDYLASQQSSGAG
jgi:uncharacterized protein YyaL (SSP411 family)